MRSFLYRVLNSPNVNLNAHTRRRSWIIAMCTPSRSRRCSCNKQELLQNTKTKLMQKQKFWRNRKRIMQGHWSQSALCCFNSTICQTFFAAGAAAAVWIIGFCFLISSSIENYYLYITINQPVSSSCWCWLRAQGKQKQVARQSEQMLPLMWNRCRNAPRW